jgi:hypothetical protein
MGGMDGSNNSKKSYFRIMFEILLWEKMMANGMRE